MKKSEADKLRIEFSKALMALLFSTLQVEAGIISTEEGQKQGEDVGERLSNFIDSLVDEE